MDLTQLGEITDPSDFSLESLRKLDSTFRCTICKEFFEAPVSLTQCGHSFCSLCIRNSLPSKPECPLCKKAAKESHLVRNVMFAEAVEAWCKSRKIILDLIKDATPPSAERTSKKRKRQHLEGPSDAGELGSDSSSNGRPKLDEEVIAIPSGSEADEEVVSPKKKRSEEVACPLCSARVLMSSINSHIDSQCKRFFAEEEQVDKTKSKAAWNSIFKQGKRRLRESSQDAEIPSTRLAKVSYGTLTLASLKKLLSDFGLQTTGDKDALITRHERWLAIYNANLDRVNPKPLSELKLQLCEMEEAASRPRPKKISDEKEWTIKNQDQFKLLIAQAKSGSKSRKTETAERADALCSEEANGI